VYRVSVSTDPASVRTDDPADHPECATEELSMAASPHANLSIVAHSASRYRAIAMRARRQKTSTRPDR
jgi:hypothetical protein